MQLADIAFLMRTCHVIYVHAMADVGCRLLTLTDRCVEAMDVAGKACTILADDVCRLLTMVTCNI